jgi:formate dehydrogenase
MTTRASVVVRNMGSKLFHSSTYLSGKVLALLYPNPITGYPPLYARDFIPKILGYPDGSTTPTPNSVDFKGGELLGCVSGELGLRKYLESNGHALVVTAENCEMEKHLADTEVIICQPFYPFYLTAERIKMAPNLKMAITAGRSVALSDCDH